MTQAYTKIACVNTEKKLWVHNIILANQNKVVVNGTQWLTQKDLCVIKGICAQTQNF